MTLEAVKTHNINLEVTPPPIVSEQELFYAFDSYLTSLHFDETIQESIQTHLNKMSNDKRMRWIAIRANQIGLPLDPTFLDTILNKSVEDDSKEKNRQSNLASTPESELRKNKKRNSASHRRFKENVTGRRQT